MVGKLEFDNSTMYVIYNKVVWSFEKSTERCLYSLLTLHLGIIKFILLLGFLVFYHVSFQNIVISPVSLEFHCLFPILTIEMLDGFHCNLDLLPP